MPQAVKFPFQNTELLVEDRVKDLVNRFTLDEKIELMMQHQPEIKRLGIKAHKQGTEAAHGIAWLGEATVFPQNIGLSSTWNKDLMNKIGTVIGDEARVFYQKDPSKHGLTLWAPTVDMERDPRWGRTEEAYGEDPELTGQLTTELVKGMQGNDPDYLKSVATLKHFLGNNNEINRDKCSASIDPRNMHEYYLKAFKPAIVEGKAKSIMTAYNSINGTPALLHPYVEEVVKQEWGMDGFIVSDAGDVVGIVNDHKYYETYSEALADTIKSGIDSITDDAEISLQAMRDALSKGLLVEADLDKALINTFKVRFRLGEFDEERNPYAFVSESKLLAKEHKQLSYQAAQEQVVLLKNDGLLPLNEGTTESIAVIGPLSDDVLVDWYSGTPSYRITALEAIEHKLQNKKVIHKSGNPLIRIRSVQTGSYIGLDQSFNHKLMANCKVEEAEIFEWTDWGWGSQTLKSLSTGKYVTVGEAMMTATADEARGWFVKESFQFIENSEGMYRLQSWDEKRVVISDDQSLIVQEHDKESVETGAQYEIEVIEAGIEEAVKAAAEQDYAVVVLGNNPFINGKECIDREDIVLPPEQEKLLQAVKQVNPNTIAVLVSSYPYALNWANENLSGIMYTSHAGPELGKAVADVLFGDYNPAGRLSMTWYRSVDQLPDIMDYDIIKGKRTYQYFEGEVLYPFGHGLSYTTFNYSNIQVNETTLSPDDQVKVTISIENTGRFAGDEVVQLYGRAERSRVKRPLKTLLDFTRVHLQSGEKKQIEFTVPISKLEFWDVTQERYCVEKGVYSLLIGSSSKNIACCTEIQVDGDNIPARNLHDGVSAFNYDDYENVIIDEYAGRNYCVRTVGNQGWIAFHQVNGTIPCQKIKITAFSFLEEGEIRVHLGRLDGEMMGKASFPKSDDWQEVEVELSLLPEESDMYFILNGDIQVSKLQLL
ncbi:beta-glucosidase [Alkalihalobacillus alcalophilus ATCC 27647 = CGMCC 1.3604]|uniref:Beta-glucosidase n=1 Tax=Alkalihalobacillus alcalophilus ATCC 27647 = CGMCC 1.3604 TaxID=1218173 RepID=A0A094WQ61_ALKAL|nr:glycoside hydrolase family 3 protein [Alkalihalobacillus alcalophilus]KGA98956.1 beta-glucosidase [Alkalihalobacillus alcalophilus ATCC 27647 = CGMCC 1.3604]MED1561992.1 glycoside hydrolase family 3 C-terminal domain-containing protein [Alkalihalobacillus alcalophilus]THG89140.1 beta-glucosidase [Alkalihalobacillus alcalophilus ATCC 27647 = CGMCC 1.3604]